MDPAAYNAAINARIIANKALTNGRKMTAAIAKLLPDAVEQKKFEGWLRGDSLVRFHPQYEAVMKQYDDENGWTEDNDRLMSRITNESRKKYGYPPKFLTEAIQKWGGLTEKQLDVGLRAWKDQDARTAKFAAADAARRAGAESWTPTRYKGITGVVKSVKEEEGDYGLSRKMMVALPDGRMLWTTIPSAIIQCLKDWKLTLEQQLKGKTVTIGSVTVEPSENDPTMGFGKRPNGGSVGSEPEPGISA